MIRLSELLLGLECRVIGDDKISVGGISYDSRNIRKNDIFFAVKGHNTEGGLYVESALKSGAAAVVSENEIDLPGKTLIVVSDIKSALARISANFYGHPDKELLVVGITGTNGKTTTTYFIESIFNNIFRKTGVIGTVNYRYSGKVMPAPNTTPQSSDVYSLLREMADHKNEVAVMEVSSHALDLKRVEGVEFDVAVYSNLTQDHLDFHRTMENYFNAKAKLFTNLNQNNKKIPKFAIINKDDEWGRKLISLTNAATVLTYGIHSPADIYAENIRISSKSTEFILQTPVGHKKIRIPHIGEHNVYNAMAAAGVALSQGVSLEAVIAGLEGAPMVPGRLERVEAGQPYTAVVDYAHTDDALKNVLSSLRKLNPARLITVFGCGGDRDRTKRPLMGAVATELSDFVFITSDNPRTEDPQKIALDIETGIRKFNRNNYQVIIDREKAIAAAINMAQKGDVILLAGKGHETYQIIGKEKIHFNDAEIANKYISLSVKTHA